MKQIKVVFNDEWKEGNYLTTHSTRFVAVIWKEGHVLFNDAHILITVIWRQAYCKVPQ